MNKEELETRVANGEKFIGKKTLDWYLIELHVMHLKGSIKIQCNEILFTRKMMFFAWIGWLITALCAGAMP